MIKNCLINLFMYRINRTNRITKAWEELAYINIFNLPNI